MGYNTAPAPHSIVIGSGNSGLSMKLLGYIQDLIMNCQVIQFKPMIQEDARQIEDKKCYKHFTVMWEAERREKKKLGV